MINCSQSYGNLFKNCCVFSFVFIGNHVKFMAKLSFKKAKQLLNYLVLRPFYDVQL